jgi:Rieske Fe-S protein
LKDSICIMPMHKMNRKTFLWLSGVIFTGGFVVLWKRMIDELPVSNTKHGSVRIVLPGKNGIFFYDDFYIVNNNDDTKAFSTTCSHAGCRLKNESNGIITCSCHGSKFDAYSGKPIKGPAFKPLNQLPCTYSENTGEVLVNK